MSDVGLHTVFESLAWPASVSLPRTEFAIHELLGQPVVIHRDHVTNPTELGFQDHGLDAGHLGSFQDLKVCVSLMPVNVHDRPQAFHVELLCATCIEHSKAPIKYSAKVQLVFQTSNFSCTEYNA